MGYQGYCPRVKLLSLIQARSQENRRSPDVHTRCLHSVPSGREYDLELREIRLEGEDPVEVQSWQDYYREKWHL